MENRGKDPHKGSTRVPARSSESAPGDRNPPRGQAQHRNDPRGYPAAQLTTSSYAPPNIASYPPHDLAAPNPPTSRTSIQNYNLNPGRQSSRIDQQQTNTTPNYPYPESARPFATRPSAADPTIVPGISGASRRSEPRYHNGATRRTTDHNEEAGANPSSQTVINATHGLYDQESVNRARLEREDPASEMASNTNRPGGQHGYDPLEPIRTPIRRDSTLEPPDRLSYETLVHRSNSHLTTATSGSQYILPTRPRDPAPAAPFTHNLRSDLRDFALLPRNDLRGVAKYALRNPEVLSADSQLFFDEAVRAYASGKREYGDSLVQQGVIVRRLQRRTSDGHRSDPKSYFERLLDERSRSREDHFLEFDRAQKDAKDKSKSVSTEQQPLSRGPGSRDPDDLGVAAESKYSRVPALPQQGDLSQSPMRTDTTRHVAFQNLPSTRGDSTTRRDALSTMGGDIMGQPTQVTTRRHSLSQNSGSQLMGSQSTPRYNTLGQSTSRNAAPSRPSQDSTDDSAIRLPTASGIPQSTVTPETEPPSVTLDPRFVLRSSSFYRVGRVFAVLWHEPHSETAPASRYTYTSNGPVSIGRFGARIYTTVRRMVVVRSGRGFCVCIQINTYAGRGLGKFKNEHDIQAHSIIYMSDTKPMLLRDEPKTSKRPIAVKKSQQEHHLDPASRLCYARPHSVEHTVKSMDIGLVEEDCLQHVIKYYAEINNVS